MFQNNFLSLWSTLALKSSVLFYLSMIKNYYYVGLYTMYILSKFTAYICFYKYVSIHYTMKVEMLNYWIKSGRGKSASSGFPFPLLLSYYLEVRILSCTPFSSNVFCLSITSPFIKCLPAFFTPQMCSTLVLSLAKKGASILMLMLNCQSWPQVERSWEGEKNQSRLWMLGGRRIKEIKKASFVN